jgi:hypothetical protein
MRASKTLSWKAVSYGAGALSTVLTRRMLVMVWNRFRDVPPPENLADRRASWMQAVSWAVATGVGIGVTRLLALRSAATVWEAATHEAPPGLTPS